MGRMLAAGDHRFAAVPVAGASGLCEGIRLLGSLAVLGHNSAGSHITRSILVIPLSCPRAVP